jgi:hypothetical protein
LIVAEVVGHLQHAHERPDRLLDEVTSLSRLVDTLPRAMGGMLRATSEGLEESAWTGP